MKIKKSRSEATCKKCHKMILPNEKYVEVETRRKVVGEDGEGNSIWNIESIAYCLGCALEKGLIKSSDIEEIANHPKSHT